MSSFLHHYTKEPWIQIYRLKLFQDLASLLVSFYLKLFHNCILDSGKLNSLRSLWRIHMLTTNVPIAKPVSRFRLRSIAAFFCQWWSSCRRRSNCFSAAVKAGFTTLSGSPPAMISTQYHESEVVSSSAIHCSWGNNFSALPPPSGLECTFTALQL